MLSAIVAVLICYEFHLFAQNRGHAFPAVVFAFPCFSPLIIAVIVAVWHRSTIDSQTGEFIDAGSMSREDELSRLSSDCSVGLFAACVFTLAELAIVGVSDLVSLEQKSSFILDVQGESIYRVVIFCGLVLGYWFHNFANFYCRAIMVIGCGWLLAVSIVLPPDAAQTLDSLRESLSDVWKSDFYRWIFLWRWLIGILVACLYWRCGLGVAVCAHMNHFLFLEVLRRLCR